MIKQSLSGMRGELSGTGWAPYCGPAVVAYITGQTYADSEAAVKAAALAVGFRYGRQRIINSWWPHVVKAAGLTMPPGLGHIGIPRVYWLKRPRLEYPTMAAWTRQTPPGLYLVRVTHHFAVLERTTDGRTLVHDTVNDGTDYRSSKWCGRRKRVTHMIRLDD